MEEHEAHEHMHIRKRCGEQNGYEKRAHYLF